MGGPDGDFFCVLTLFDSMKVLLILASVSGCFASCVGYVRPTQAEQDPYSGVYKQWPVHLPSSAHLTSDSLVRLNSDSTLQSAMGFDTAGGFFKICHAPFGGSADCHEDISLTSFPDLAYTTTTSYGQLMVSVSCVAKLGFVSQF